MHRVFTIDEVLRLILSDLGRGDILQSSLVCQVFLEPALDIIWGSMNSLAPFFRLLPPKSIIDKNRNLSLTRPLEQQDWERLDYYAPRCKSLHLPIQEFSYLSPTSWHDWSKYHKERFKKEHEHEERCPPLLVNLTMLCVVEEPVVLQFATQVLVGPKLQTCRLIRTQGVCYSALSEDFVNSLDFHRPSLTVLGIPPLRLTSPLSARLATIISSMASLTNISLVPRQFACSEIARALAGLPTLRSLSIESWFHGDFGEDSEFLIPRCLTESGRLPSLQSLKGSKVQVEAMLRAVLSESISDVEVTSVAVPDRSGAQYVVGFCETITRCCPGLRRLVIKGLEAEDGVYRERATTVQGSNILQPFKHSVELLEFEFRHYSDWTCHREFNLTNQEYAAGIQRWSNLTSFSVHCDESIGMSFEPPLATLDVLTAFAASCPKLSYLSLDLDATIPHDAAAVETGPSFRIPLTFAVRGSWIKQKNIDDVVSFLSWISRNTSFCLDLSPNDETAPHCWDGEKERRQAWLDVKLRLG